jgi:predicted nucleic acid-binding protein
VIVLDASAAVELVLGTAIGRTVARRIAPARESVHAPHLIDLEVAQALRRGAASGQASGQRFREALDDFCALDLERYPHDILLPRIWELRANLSAYDAAYIALAEALSAPLVTCDAALHEAPGSRAEVEVLSRQPR